MQDDVEVLKLLQEAHWSNHNSRVKLSITVDIVTQGLHILISLEHC